MMTTWITDFGTVLDTVSEYVLSPPWIYIFCISLIYPIYTLFRRLF